VGLRKEGPARGDFHEGTSESFAPGIALCQNVARSGPLGVDEVPQGANRHRHYEHGAVETLSTG
jgi:hypothetical protein